MSILESAGPAILAGFAVSFALSILIPATKRWHGRFSFDSHLGPQKFDQGPIPRIGGCALYLGLAAATAASAPPIRELLLTLAVCAVPAFAAGLAEDITEKASVRLRLLATIVSGTVFCIYTGMAITRLDFAIIDGFMALPLISIAFTVFMIAGFTNASNFIDGLHGLAAGTAIIMLCALAILALRSEDANLALAMVAAAAVLAGFLAINFPFGYLFLGDGGAYLAGLMPAMLAIMLVVRNSEISVWVVAVLLAYPVLDTLWGIVRKTLQEGTNPGRPDELHLHHLLHDWLGSKLRERPGREWLANPLTSVILWGGGPATGLVFVLLLPHTRGWALLVLALQVALYVVVYTAALSSQRNRGSHSTGSRRRKSRRRDPAAG